MFLTKFDLFSATVVEPKVKKVKKQKFHNAVSTNSVGKKISKESFYKA